MENSEQIAIESRELENSVKEFFARVKLSEPEEFPVPRGMGFLWRDAKVMVVMTKDNNHLNVLSFLRKFWKECLERREDL